MDFVWFNLFSTIESIGMFVLMLALFRFRIKQYIVHMIFASFLLSQMSYYMRTVFDLGLLVTLIYIFFTFLFVWLMFRIQIFYAAIMAVVGYVSLTIIQVVLILISVNLNLFTMTDVAPFTVLAYIQQSITLVVCIVISYILLRKRFGFTFIPYSDSIRVKIKGENIVFLIFVITAVVIAGINIYWSLQGMASLISALVLLLCALASLIYLAIRRETKDD